MGETSRGELGVLTSTQRTWSSGTGLSVNRWSVTRQDHTTARESRSESNPKPQRISQRPGHNSTESGSFICSRYTQCHPCLPDLSAFMGPEQVGTLTPILPLWGSSDPIVRDEKNPRIHWQGGNSLSRKKTKQNPNSKAYETN